MEVNRRKQNRGWEDEEEEKGRSEEAEILRGEMGWDKPSVTEEEEEEEE